MGLFYDHIPEDLAEWMLKQPMFWVSSAPLSGEGHVNVSPKGTPDSFHMTNPNQVWYEDLSGSGVETISHLREPGNGRTTVLFQAMEGGPRLLRLFGKGKVSEIGTPEYESLIPRENRKAGSRAAIGFEDVKGVRDWWHWQNMESIDGLPGLSAGVLEQRIPINSFDRRSSAYATVKKVPNAVEAGVESSTETERGAVPVDVKTVGAFLLGGVCMAGLFGWKYIVESVGALGSRLLN
ncbi:hypothetical protein CONPUDRAFT_158580 [Coniophora puteana RWD-64-598 SS2]|uniref:Pyridoxamine 5'-phosphate oxidase putative domain-containing protein n=1 Tax=Coniophora puteana (strain RWD-64-598) TaxID=741705 RepID=A0A5M3MAX5_CONPW|nr:uncharacterized protein CONPUDRAFT_158580 [Coniophora puteana RWD-64-598 SS2]EIW75791.1 hypothetical protein CONPUDRAFT_158580 [Coniophora puteana RWD-64-598 SS2]